MRPKSITISGQSETEKLVDYVNQLGLKRTAEKYGTNASSLSRWLRTQGFTKHNVWKLTTRAKKELDREEALDGFFQQLAEVENAQ